MTAEHASDSPRKARRAGRGCVGPLVKSPAIRVAGWGFQNSLTDLTDPAFAGAG